MADDKKVTMVALADLVDAEAGFVSGGDEFETTPELAESYRKAQWARPPGKDAREIQLEVARDQLEKRAEAKRFALSSRQSLHNLVGDDVEKGYIGVDGGNPATVGTVGSQQERSTNQQAVGEESEGKKSSKKDSEAK